MSLRTKLTAGLGFLFVIIIALAIYNSYNIQTLSNESEKILKDNYDSLLYCKNMLLALDDMRNAVGRSTTTTPSSYAMNLFDGSRETFERNLELEKGNITELHEKDYVEDLVVSYGVFHNLCSPRAAAREGPHVLSSDFLSAYMNVRQAIVRINDLNMEAVERKNLSTKHDARNMILSMAAIGAACVLLAFFYFWYFPFYISNTLAYLTVKMRTLLKNAGIVINVDTKDEAFVLLQSIELLERKLGRNSEIKN